MPIYEYKCGKCSEEFEKLVYSSTKVECPKCGSAEVKKKPSTFGMSGLANPAAESSSSGCSSCRKSSCANCH